MPNSQAGSFFIVGGTLGGSAASYVQRPLDDDLLRLTSSGEYCNVLAARQMGKSSLMVRTAARLREQGTRVAIIDTTSIGSSVTSSEWYFGLVSRLARELKLAVNEQAWWETMSSKSPVQRFSDFLRDVVLEEIKDPIVIFVDEIDSTLKLNFTDDFFAAIRAAYNARSVDEAYKRLTFVLLGVARPGDLIKDRTRTPYNIGVNVDVTDFEISELASFQAVLDEYFPSQGLSILQWVLGWTGGQPYLTQKLCAEIVGRNNGKPSEDVIGNLVETLFISDKARTETNLRSIRDRISNNPYVVEMLRVYQRVLSGKQIAAEERSIAHNELKITGLVKVSDQGYLQIRNRIYEKIFDENWAKNSIPANLSNRRLITVISSVAVLAIAFAGYFYYRQQNQAVEIQAQTYIDNFNTSTSQEVRITSLAGLFELGGEYETQAKELFTSLASQDQQALFELATPENVGNELFIVVDGLYQDMPDTEEGNSLLSKMAGVLEQSNATGATGLVIEINDWLAGRDALAQEQYEVAIVSFTRAWDRSEQRDKPNLGVLLERALAYVAFGQYDNALMDFDKVIELDRNRAGEVNGIILGESNVELANYFRAHSSEFRNIADTISLPAVTPTISPTIINFNSTPLPAEIINKGVEMVLVPAGEFIMGDALRIDPLLHTVYLDGYYIDKYEVTNTLYSICVEKGNCSTPHTPEYIPDHYNDPVYANHPVVLVDWLQAKAYCEWRGARLPSEAEWEKAARGTDGRTYPWGEGISCSYANYDPPEQNCVGHTTEVGSYERGKSPYGVYDMAGNVLEWVSSLVDFPYPYNANDGRENLAIIGARGNRGGAWGADPGWGSGRIARSSHRTSSEQTEYNSNLGFRCAMDATP